MRYSLELAGAEGWVMTNLDVLTGFPEIAVGVAYRRGSQRWTDYPAHLPTLDGIEVELVRLPTWTEDITGMREYEELPENARRYVEWVEKEVGHPVRMLSVGPDREQVISRGL
jgi:adenylosuccinate synthase